MRRYAEKRFAEKRTILVGAKCCLCGASQPRTLSAGDWAERVGETREVKVEMNLGRGEEDGGCFGSRTSYDVCPSCFEAKLAPWFESQGAEPNVEEY